jgi:2-methylcitrate dehydratase PrpD
VKAEEIVTRFIKSAAYEDMNEVDIDIVKKQILTYVGATIAGSSAEGAETVVNMARQIGGANEATILVHGGKVPAQSAAFCNGVMGRALDICDHISPGMHAGSGMIAAAFAATEMVGGISGKDFMNAIAVGDEIALRLNLEEADYSGFDPTGVGGIWGPAAATAKILKLDEEAILNTMALTFNRAGASFQSNIDGSLAVRVIEGWIAQAGVECARLAQNGITGPENYLDGIYGYFHLFTRNRTNGLEVLGDLGQKPYLTYKLGFKKYPSCGMTQGSTQLIQDMMRQYGFVKDDVDRIILKLPQYGYKLVGKFELGKNPKVNAQFGTPYCIANALVRGEVKLSHFEPEFIKDPEVLRYAEMVEVVCDPEMDHTRKHYSSDIKIITKDGQEYNGSIDVSPGTEGTPLADAEFEKRYFDSIDFGNKPALKEREQDIYAHLLEFEKLPDVRDVIPMITA